MKRSIATVAFILTSLIMPAVAQDAEPMSLVYTQPLGGVYSQDWLAQVVGNQDESGTEVYVVGRGKSGAFFGVISVDCQTPRYSRWVSPA